MLGAMLLNELQKQTKENERQATQLRDVQQRLAALEQAVRTRSGD
jgi:hypothetical protein